MPVILMLEKISIKILLEKSEELKCVEIKVVSQMRYLYTEVLWQGT